MNKHIAPYERVSHFIALISSGSCGVSCEQCWGNSKGETGGEGHHARRHGGDIQPASGK